MMRILHVIPNLAPGGPSRSLVVMTAESLALRPDIEHSVLVLERPLYMPLKLDLKRQGCRVTEHSAAQTDQQIAEADLVVIHFWNTPVVWDWIAMGLPPARYVLWSKIEGTHPPQHLSAALVDAVCATIYTAPPPDHLSHRPDITIVPALTDMNRLQGLTPAPHDGLNVDYLGTLTRGKLHPSFFEMMDRVQVPEVRVRLCGGTLDPYFERALAATDNPSRFECLGFIEDIGDLFKTSDVFAYPLAPTTYASSDKALQEAMLAGVPPVILPHGGPARFVQHGETGLVAQDEQGFVAAVEELCREPALRHRIGRAARDFATRAFEPRAHVERTLNVLETVADQDLREFQLCPGPVVSGEVGESAARFLTSQGYDYRDARALVDSFLADGDARLIAYAEAAPNEVYQLEGGILHWRNRHPQDPILRCWSGMWLDRQEDPNAAAEFEAAAALGAHTLSIVAAREGAVSV